MRGSNAEIVWRRTRTPDGVALYPWRDCTLVAVSSRTHSKNVPVRPSWPELHRSRPPPSVAAEARCLEGHVSATGHLLGPPGQPAVTIFRIEGLVCCTALSSARPSRSSALHHGAPLAKVISTRWSQGKPGPKRGGVDCCRQRLGSRERMKDVHFEKRR